MRFEWYKVVQIALNYQLTCAICSGSFSFNKSINFEIRIAIWRSTPPMSLVRFALFPALSRAAKRFDPMPFPSALPAACSTPPCLSGRSAPPVHVSPPSLLRGFAAPSRTLLQQGAEPKAAPAVHGSGNVGGVEQGRVSSRKREQKKRP